MGKKHDLEKETQYYLNAICQSTVKRICQDSAPYKKGGSPESVRRDLWKNAVTKISSSEFSDANKMIWKEEEDIEDY